MKVILRLIATAALLPGCSSVPSLMSSEQIDQMGTQAWQEMRAQTPAIKDPKVTEYVKNVAQRLIHASPEASKIKWDIAVFDSKDVNAFALPGGHIGVYSGILPVAKNEAGLATVLGHEIGHVILEHSNKRVSQQLLTEGALAGASIALGGSSQRDNILGALGLGATVGLTLPFSRGQESEADDYGLKLMAKAGYSPEEAVAFWQRMAAASGGGGPPTFLSTHPASEDRVKALKEDMGEAVAIYRQSGAQRDRGQPVPGSGYTS